MKKIKFGITTFVHILAIALFLTSCIKEGVEEINGANIGIGDNLPSLDLTLSDDTKINDEALSNKVSLIFFFSTTCPDCIKQFPIVDKLYKDLKDNTDFIFCAVSRSQDENTVSNYWKNNNLTMPYSAQKDASVYSLFASRGIPRIYIADKDKIIRAMYDDDPIAEYADLMSDIETYLNNGNE